jgi:hypothetical protein
MSRLPVLLTILLAATAAAAQSKTKGAAASARATATAPAGAAEATPTAAIETDPVAAAVQRAVRMHEQAAAACIQAIENSRKEGPLSHSQRPLLMAAALLYNAGNELKRIAQKEQTLATKRTAAGEQKERVAKKADTDEKKAAALRKAKADIAYGTAQAAIAESILDFAQRDQELAKEADNAGTGNDGAAVDAAAKKVIEQSTAARKLYEEVRETRAKLARIGS